MIDERIDLKTNGWIILDKPEGMSSNSAMYRVRKKFSEKTGYVGTLDPFAQGVLPIAIGEARKFIPYVDDSEKEYIFTIKFGEETDTLDRDGKVIQSGGRTPRLDEISFLLSRFIGKVEQVPPVFSAVKINGVRAYKLARKGVDDIQIKSREVDIYKLEIVSEDLKNDEVTLICRCSKGTYIRSLARDICYKLDTYGYVNYLRRSEVSFVKRDKIISLDNFLELSYNELKECFLLPCESALDDIPALTLSTKDILDLQNGLHIYGFTLISGDNKLFRVFREVDNRFAGLVKLENKYLIPVRMCLFY